MPTFINRQNLDSAAIYLEAYDDGTIMLGINNEKVPITNYTMGELNEQLNALRRVHMPVSSDDKCIITIAKSVARFCDISIADMRSRTRLRPVVDARQLAIWCIRISCAQTLTSIGKYFNRDHATALYSMRNVNKLYESDKQYAQRLNELAERLADQGINGPTIAIQLMKPIWKP